VDEPAGHSRFHALFEAHHRAVFAYALRRTSSATDAEEVAAETFAIAWRRRDDVPAGNEARPWLLGTARRVLANQRRGAERRARLTLRLRERRETASASSPGDTAVLEALAQLKPEDQELLRLVAWEELGNAEIAAVLGITANAVAIRLHRARARFARELSLIRGTDSAKGLGTIRTSGGVEGSMPDRRRPEKTA